MWNSPRQASESGKRYTPTEIAALLEPLELVLDGLSTAGPAEVVSEPILQRMEPGELVLALDEVFHALLDDVPVPPAGHPGFQEAIVVELLDQCAGLVELELSEPTGCGGARARLAVWRSFTALCGECDAPGRMRYPLIEALELIYEEPEVHLSPMLSAPIWQEMILDDGAGLIAEFIGDRDWQIDELLDRPSTQAWAVAEEMGLDLNLVHQLPRAPGQDELRRARRYLRRLCAAHAKAMDRP